MKFTKKENEVLEDALTRHIEDLESYCPDDMDERIEVAQNLMCKLGFQKKVVNRGIKLTWVTYTPLNR